MGHRKLWWAFCLLCLVACLHLSAAKTHHSKRQSVQQSSPSNSRVTGRENTNWWNVWWQQYIHEVDRPTVRPIVAINSLVQRLSYGEEQQWPQRGQQQQQQQLLMNAEDMDTNLVMDKQVRTGELLREQAMSQMEHHANWQAVRPTIFRNSAHPRHSGVQQLGIQMRSSINSLKQPHKEQHLNEQREHPNSFEQQQEQVLDYGEEAELAEPGGTSDNNELPVRDSSSSGMMMGEPKSESAATTVSPEPTTTARRPATQEPRSRPTIQVASSTVSSAASNSTSQAASSLTPALTTSATLTSTSEPPGNTRASTLVATSPTGTTKAALPTSSVQTEPVSFSIPRKPSESGADSTEFSPETPISATPISETVATSQGSSQVPLQNGKPAILTTTMGQRKSTASLGASTTTSQFSTSSPASTTISLTSSSTAMSSQAETTEPSSESEGETEVVEEEEQTARPQTGMKASEPEAGETDTEEVAEDEGSSDNSTEPASGYMTSTRAPAISTNGAELDRDTSKSSEGNLPTSSGPTGNQGTGVQISDGLASTQLPSIDLERLPKTTKAETQTQSSNNEVATTESGELAKLREPSSATSSGQQSFDDRTSVVQSTMSQSTEEEQLMKITDEALMKMMNQVASLDMDEVTNSGFTRQPDGPIAVQTASMDPKQSDSTSSSPMQESETTKKRLQPPPATTKAPTGSISTTSGTTTARTVMVELGSGDQSAEGAGGEARVEMMDLDLLPFRRIISQNRAQSMMVVPIGRAPARELTDTSKVEPGMRLRPIGGSKMPSQPVYMIMMNGLENKTTSNEASSAVPQTSVTFTETTQPTRSTPSVMAMIQRQRQLMQQVSSSTVIPEIEQTTVATTAASAITDTASGTETTISTTQMSKVTKLTKEEASMPNATNSGLVQDANKSSEAMRENRGRADTTETVRTTTTSSPGVRMNEERVTITTTISPEVQTVSSRPIEPSSSQTNPSVPQMSTTRRDNTTSQSQRLINRPGLKGAGQQAGTKGISGAGDIQVKGSAKKLTAQQSARPFFSSRIKSDFERNNANQPAVMSAAIRQFGGANRMSAMQDKKPVPFGRPATMSYHQAANLEYGPSISVRRPDEPLANGQMPNCTLAGKNFCLLTNDYPMNEVRRAVERSFRSVRIMYEELQTVSDQELHKDDFNGTNNQAASGKFACQTQVEMMRPGWAKDEITKEWMLVVNTDVFPQRVRSESCAQPNTPCEFIAPLYDSTCQQRYSLHRMIAIDPHDPSRSPQVAVFKFPAGCVCRVHPIKKTTIMAAFNTTPSSPTSPINGAR